MNSYLASPLHLVASILNLPLFHKEIHTFPEQLTYQGLQLLAALSKDDAFAYQTNMDVVQFLSTSTPDLNDIKYTQATQYFVRLLVTVMGKQDPVWGAISYIMAGVANSFEDEAERECWRRLCGLLFYVFTEEGIAQIDQGDIPMVKPKPHDDRPSIDQYSVPQPNTPTLPSMLSTPTELAQKASQLLNDGSTSLRSNPLSPKTPSTASPVLPSSSSPSSSPDSASKMTPESRRGIQIKNRY